MEPDTPPPSPAKSRPRATKPRAEALEFDFITKPKTETPAIPLVPKPVTPLNTPPTPTPSFTTTAPPVTPAQPKTQPTPTPAWRNDMSNAPLKPTTITDFKRNVDQQKREQTSFGNVLTTITYVVLIGLILVTALAGFGGYQVWQRLNDQAYTIGTLDQKYEAAVLNVTEDLKRKQIELDKIAGQLSRQQEQVSVLRATLDKTIAELRAERANRIRQEATLQAIQKRLSEVDQPLNRR